MDASVRVGVCDENDGASIDRNRKSLTRLGFDSELESFSVDISWESDSEMCLREIDTKKRTDETFLPL